LQGLDCWDVLSTAIAVGHRFGFFFPPIDFSNFAATLFPLEAAVCILCI
jgi:hypothetical protein